jgi:hypothetical protein
MPTILVGDQVKVARILTLQAMLKLEIKGMTRSGRSAYSILKEEFNLKGNKQKVYDQMAEIIFNLKQQNLPLDNPNDN